MQKNWVLLSSAFLLALICFVGAENLISNSFHVCVIQSANVANNSAQLIAIIIERQTICSLYLIDRHNGFFVVLATLGIAAFTATLWRGTTEQGKVTVAALRLARDEFNATHRPRVFVQSVLIASSGRGNLEPRIDFMIANGGDGKAVMLSYQVLGYGKSNDAAFDPAGRQPETMPFNNFVLGSGQECLVCGKCKDFELEWNSFTTAMDDRFFVIGQVKYRGDDNIERSTGFCREYNRNIGMWGRVKDSEYEYNY
jgi:hypothetical protein